MKRILGFINYFFIGFSYLASKKIIVILIVCLFVGLLQVSYGYKEELTEMEEEVYTNKGNPDISYYYKNKEIEEFDDGTAVSNLMNCYQSEVKKMKFLMK